MIYSIKLLISFAFRLLEIFSAVEYALAAKEYRLSQIDEVLASELLITTVLDALRSKKAGFLPIWRAVTCVFS